MSNCSYSPIGLNVQDREFNTALRSKNIIGCSSKFNDITVNDAFVGNDLTVTNTIVARELISDSDIEYYGAIPGFLADPVEAAARGAINNAAFQAAFAATSCLKIPAKRFMLASPIVIPADTIVESCGGSLLFLDTDGLVFNGSRIIIDGISVERFGTIPGNTAITCSNFSNCQILNVKIRNYEQNLLYAWQTGLYISGPGTSISGVYNQVTGCEFTASQYTMVVDSLQFFVVSDTKFTSTTSVTGVIQITGSVTNDIRMNGIAFISTTAAYAIQVEATVNSNGVFINGYYLVFFPLSNDYSKITFIDRDGSSYTAGDATDWATSAPATVWVAIDRLADVVRTLNGGTPIP